MTSLAFERLHVQRMPGIVDGFELDALSPGLNVVHGPNASGKTTTARALAALLWSGTMTDDAWLAASVRVGEESWTVRLEGRRARWQRHGVDVSAAVLPAAELRDRYTLSLHELLIADDAGFAAAIARESAGGYDLQAAAAVLDPRAAASRCRAELEEWKNARARLDAARSAQDALQGEERELREIEARIVARAGLAARIDLLERALEHAGRRDEAEEAARGLGRFEAGMERLLGNEAERLHAIDGKLAEARADAAAAEVARERAAAERAGCGLPEEGLPSTLIPALHSALDALREREREMQLATERLREAEARAAREWAGIEGGVDPERLIGIRQEDVESLAALAREAEKLGAKRAELEAQLGEPTSSGEPIPEAEVLRSGILSLRGWLRSGEAGAAGQDPLRRLALAGAAGMIVLGLLLFFVHPALTLTAVIGLVLLVLTLRSRQGADARPIHRAEFEKLALTPPSEWSDAAVAERLSALEAEVARTMVAEERTRRREDAARALAALDLPEAELTARRTEMCERLGLDAAASDGALVWRVERIGRWYEARAAIDGAAAALEAAREGQAAARARATDLLASHTEASVPDAAVLAGALADLEHRQKAFDVASGQLRAALDASRMATGIAEALEVERREIFAGLGLGESEMARVEEWCRGFTDFRKAQEEHRLRVAQRDALAERLAGLGGFEPALLIDAGSSIGERLAATREEAAELERMRVRATEIRTRIKDATRAHAVEEALAGYAAAEDALRSMREKDVRSATADALIRFVQGRTRDQHRPEVFHRARAWFSKITHGRYRLEFDDGDLPAFRAVDTITGTGHPLDELSSASRIQLLLSVRLAFVETREQGVKLPLVLDETLGNSDDERAHAIMEALLETAAEGRQIFYFTAQPDEVGKWRALLDGRDVPCAFVDLAERRRLEKRVAVPGLRIAHTPGRVIPTPAGMDHREYGQALGVPAIDAYGPVEGVHLWYLVEDTEALHRLLVLLRVERWGQLREVVEHGAGELLDPALFARIRAGARALEIALELARIGRGRTVDRTVISNSGAVTSRFLDDVCALCATCGGNARALLDALEKGEVKQFRGRSREALQEFMEENGYLDPRAPLEVAVLRARVLAAVSAEIESGVLDAAGVDLLLERASASLSQSAAIL